MKNYARSLYRSLFIISLFSLVGTPVMLLAQEEPRIVGESTDIVSTEQLPFVEKAGTVEGLNTVLDYLNDRRTPGLSVSNYCTEENTLLNPLSDNARGSLAWNENSYTWVFALKGVDTLSVSQQTLFDKAKESYEVVSPALALMTTKDVTADYYDRHKAVVRTALIGMGSEFHADAVDGARMDKLVSLLNDSYACLKSFTGEESLSLDTIKKSDDAITSLAMAWDSAKGEFNISNVPALTHVSLSGKEARAQGEVVGAPSTPDASTSLESFALYAKNRMVGNSHIRALESDDSAVKTYYNQRGRLLGFIPVWMKVRTAVTTEGITVRYSWYAFMSKVSGGKVAPTEVGEMLGEEPGELTPSRQAQIFDASVQAFEAKEAQ